jgi:hypothetical protein
MSGRRRMLTVGIFIGASTQVEHDLAWVRLLIGLHATRARSEVNEIVSGIVEMGAALQFTEDKLINIMEAAQVG